MVAGAETPDTTKHLGLSPLLTHPLEGDIRRTSEGKTTESFAEPENFFPWVLHLHSHISIPVPSHPKPLCLNFLRPQLAKSCFFLISYFFLKYDMKTVAFKSPPHD